MRDFRTILERSRESRSRRPRASTFVMYGREWDLLPDVYAPNHSATTTVAMELLGLPTEQRPRAFPVGASLLEMGSGAGVIAVTAALFGSTRVTAVDINPAAVHNTTLNAVRHGVDDRVRAVRGDLFDNVPADERFDVIFWSSPYVHAPDDYAYRHVHERAYVDAGYAAHQRFLAEAPRWLAPGGAVLLHFSTRGSMVALLRAAMAHRRGLHILRGRTHDDEDHMLIEITTPEPPDAD